MTDYYETFKPQAASDIVRFAKQRDDLAVRLKNARRNLQKGQDESASYGRGIADLKARSAKSLAGGTNDFAKFKTSLRKKTDKKNTCDEAVRILQNETIPETQTALDETELNLKLALNRHLLGSRHTVDAEIDELLRRCLGIRQDFLDAFAKIYSDFGVVLCVNDEVYAPSPWTYQEVEVLKRRLKMAGPQQDAPTEATEAPQSVQDEPTASEPTQEAAQDAPELEGATITILGGEL